MRKNKNKEDVECSLVNVKWSEKKQGAREYFTEKSTTSN